MDKIVTVDEKGRIRLPKEYRKLHGKRYRVFTVGERLEILPISDPMTTLKKEFEKLPSEMSREDLLRYAEEKAKKEALEQGDQRE